MIPNRKKVLRASFRTLRKNIASDRRKEASHNACEFLLRKTTAFSSVCSFASKKEEIDLWALNKKLSETRKLLLPRIDGKHLEVFWVCDLANDLEEGEFSLLQPKMSCKVFADTIGGILVPGLSFDGRNHRLGFGHGFYDRFLEKYPDVLKIGVGFREQFYKDALPIESHDQSVDQLYLF